MKYAIYYFSGTGNSLWSASKFAAALEDAQIIPISPLMKDKKNRIIVDAENMVIVFPAYAYEAPLMVRRFIKKAQINSKRIMAVVTYGSRQGGALAEMKRVLSRKGLTLDYADGIRCVENYIPLFGETDETIKQQRIIEQAQKTDEIIRNIQNLVNRDVVSVRPLSMTVSKIFRFAKPVIVNFYKVKKTCNGCGICEKVCPARAIKMKETKKGKRPKFSRRKCEHCQACFNYCPQKATQHWRLKAGKGRYHHPEVPLSAILEQKAETEN